MSHIDTLVEAIKGIDVSAFVHFNNRRVEILNERSFAYELYRVWYHLIERNPEGLVINAEITKENNQFQDKAKELFGDRTERFYPDMVLHHSQWDSDAQELICEIKLNKNLTSESLLRDLKKLIAYTSSEVVLFHPFKQAVFILINGSEKNIVEKIQFDEIKDYLESPIICLFVNIEEGRIGVESKTIKEILQHSL